MGTSNLDHVLQDTYVINVSDHTFVNALGTLSSFLNKSKPGKFRAAIRPSAEYLAEMQNLMVTQLQPKLDQFETSLTGFTPGPIIADGKVNKYNYAMTGKAVMRVTVGLKLKDQSMTVTVQVATEFVGVRAPEVP